MFRVQPQAVSYILMDCLWKSLYFICGRIKSEAIFALGGSYLRNTRRDSSFAARTWWSFAGRRYVPNDIMYKPRGIICGLDQMVRKRRHFSWSELLNNIVGIFSVSGHLLLYLGLLIFCLSLLHVPFVTRRRNDTGGNYELYARYSPGLDVWAGWPRTGVLYIHTFTKAAHQGVMST